MATKTLITNSRHNISHQNGNTFPKELFHKIWLKIGVCKYSYIAETKIVNRYSVALLWEKQILKSAREMLIYAK